MEQFQYRKVNTMMKGSQGGIETLNSGTLPKRGLYPVLNLVLETEKQSNCTIHHLNDSNTCTIGCTNIP